MAAPDSLQTYCSASKELTVLKQRTSEDLKEIREARKTATGLLLEMQSEPETVAMLPDGGCYSVRVKEQQKRPTVGAEVFEAMEDFWKSDAVDQLRRELEEDATLDPVEAVVQRLIETVWPPPITKRTLDVKPAKETSARVQDLPKAPVSCTDLLVSVVAAKKLVGDRANSVREEAKRLKEICQKAEERLLPELAKLPEGYVRRVTLRDGALEDTFFLRLKAARRLPKRKFSDVKVTKTLKALFGERAQAEQRAEVVRRVCSPDLGRALCRDAAELLAQPGGETPGPRIALDRVKLGLHSFIGTARPSGFTEEK
jgi:hypothetical protein